MGNTGIWMMVLMAVVLVIFIVSSITSRKKKKQEKARRQKEVKEVIKSFMRQELKLLHKTIEFDQVISRSSKEYRYRDVFDVIVKLYNPKKNQLFATKAFEIEGFTKQITKKEYETIWKVNCELDLDETLKKIEFDKAKKAKVKRKSPEIKKMLAEEKIALKASIEAERQEAKAAKKKQKNYEKPSTAWADKFAGFKKENK